MFFEFKFFVFIDEIKKQLDEVDEVFVIIRLRGQVLFGGFIDIRGVLRWVEIGSVFSFLEFIEILGLFYVVK